MKAILRVATLILLFFAQTYLDAFQKEYVQVQDRPYLSSDTVRTVKLRMTNGLEVYIISDPAIVQSSAAIAVEVGSWNDPVEHPGLAHFVEHLLFMGTKDYPGESEYSQFILENGGEYNAFTDHSRTVYGFCIEKDHFAQGLNRFSRFFVDPLFLPSTIAREKYAIDHEFADHIDNDAVRIWRVLKETGNLLHPNAIFSCGNLESLHSVTQKDIKDWFTHYYAANSMHLAVLSSHPLEELVELVLKNFSDIANSEEKEEIKYSQLTSEKQKGHMIYVAPSYKNRGLQLIWEVPKEFTEEDGKRAFEMVQMSLGHGGSNSLEKILQSEQLAREVVVDFWKIEKNHTLFLIDIALTRKGVGDTDTVILRCFQALNRLRKIGVKPSLFEQLYESEKQLLENPSIKNPFQYIMKSACAMTEENFDTYPTKTSLPSSFDSEFVSAFIDSLTPQSCIYFLLAHPNETGISCNSIEKWMRSPYVVRGISDAKLLEWQNAPLHPLIDLREENGFQGESEFFDEEEDSSGELLSLTEEKSADIRWYFMPEARQDRVSLFFCITTPSFGGSLKTSALSNLFFAYLQEKLKELFPQDKSESLVWLLEATESEMTLYLKIQKPNAEEQLRHFFSVFKKVDVSQEAFEHYKDLCFDRQEIDLSPLEYAQHVARSFLSPLFYTHSDVCHKIPYISYAEFVNFAEHFFDKVYIEGAFCGNYSKEKALRYWQEIKETLNAEPFMVQEKIGSAFSPLVPLTDPLLILQKTHRRGNAFLLLLDVGHFTKEKWAIQKIVTVLLQKEFFEELRIKQQIAYRLYTWEEQLRDKLLHYFAIQSSDHSPQELLYLVESFLEGFIENFETIVSRNRIENIQNSLVNMIKTQIQTLDSKEDRKWAVASMECLKGVSYERISKFVREAFSDKNHKRLAVLVEGRDMQFDHTLSPKMKIQYEWAREDN